MVFFSYVKFFGYNILTIHHCITNFREDLPVIVFVVNKND